MTVAPTLIRVRPIRMLTDVQEQQLVQLQEQRLEQQVLRPELLAAEVIIQFQVIITGRHFIQVVSQQEHVLLRQVQDLLFVREQSRWPAVRCILLPIHFTQWVKLNIQAQVIHTTSANDAKSFLDTDAVLKIRVKPRPQPKPPVGKSWCFGRVTGQSSDTWGYMKLKYSVSVRAVNTDGSLGPFQGTTAQTTTVNSCSPAIDFSGFAQSAPNGLVVVVHDVQSDQGCTYQQGCTAYRTVRAASCWQMDLEVAVDGTQSF